MSSVDPWFAVTPIADGVWRIAEPRHIASWLVVGPDAAVLIDSGLGLRPIADEVAALTDRPVTVVNTHAHFDHIGGNAAFERIALHPAGRDRLACDTPRSILDAYASFARAGIDTPTVTDEVAPNALIPDEPARALTEDIDRDLDTWAIPGRVQTRKLSDGEVVHLGGERQLRVIHTPGHTPDSICLLLEFEGILFTGDTVNSGEIYAFEAESDLSAFADSTRRLANELGHEVHMLCMAHDIPTVVDGSFLTAVADAFGATVSGEAHLEAGEDPLSGSRCLRATLGLVTILVPDPAHPVTGIVAGWSA